jgi:hypothetical protein
MTAKDFNLIAEILKDLLEDYADDGRAVEVIEDTAQEFAVRLLDSNPRFDSARFLTACGIK